MSSISSSDLEAWREVHQALAKAVKIAKEAVDIQRAQRRYWLEEICANISDDGKLTPTSVWKRPTALRRAPAKRSSGKMSAAALKRKKKESPEDNKPAKRPRKKASVAEDDDNEIVTPSASRSLASKSSGGKRSRKESDLKSELNEADEDDDDAESSDMVQASGMPTEYRREEATMAVYPPMHHQWAPLPQDLQMMAAVAFATNPAAAYPHLMGAPYNPYFAPPVSAAPPMAPPSVYPPAGVRTYASIQDVGQSDDESDQDQF